MNHTTDDTYPHLPPAGTKQQPRRISEARVAWRNMTEPQRCIFLRWLLTNNFSPVGFGIIEVDRGGNVLQREGEK